jgi:hypothetical protein
MKHMLLATSAMTVLALGCSARTPPMVAAATRPAESLPSGLLAATRLAELSPVPGLTRAEARAIAESIVRAQGPTWKLSKFSQVMPENSAYRFFADDEDPNNVTVDGGMMKIIVFPDRTTHVAGGP